MKARWQTRKMAEIGGQPIMFFDEPGLAGLGSSAFITITNEDIISSFTEVFAGVQAETGLTGVHVCANTEWPVLFESGVDIVSYDAYSYFDKLILYADHLVNFFARGGILATGIVPTAPEFIDIETVDGLVEKWFEQSRRLQAIGIDGRSGVSTDSHHPKLRDRCSFSRSGTEGTCADKRSIRKDSGFLFLIY